MHPATTIPEQVPGKSLRLGSLGLPSRFCLAPLAGYTNLPFRLAVREMGGLGLATTDLVNARTRAVRAEADAGEAAANLDRALASTLETRKIEAK